MMAHHVDSLFALLDLGFLLNASFTLITERSDQYSKCEMTDRVKSNDIKELAYTHEAFLDAIILRTFHTEELDLCFFLDVSVTLITKRSDGDT